MARTGLEYIRNEVRGLCEAGTADYTVGTVTFWPDDTLDDLLDQHYQYYYFYQLDPQWSKVPGGALQSFSYYLPARYFEQGGTVDPDIFYLQDMTGGTVDASLYTADYKAGVLTFSADTKGTIFYVTGSSYDVNAAAADIWTRKAAHYASAYNFSTDKHSMQRETLMQHCMEMAQFYSGQSLEGVGSTDLERDDTC